MFKELLKRECDYEWDSDVEKEIQEQIMHWVNCYPELVVRTENGIMIPMNIKNDLWRDILTSIFDIHNDYITKKLKIESMDKNKSSKED